MSIICMFTVYLVTILTEVCFFKYKVRKSMEEKHRRSVNIKQNMYDTKMSGMNIVL